MPVLASRFFNGGVYLPRLGLWLDPHDPITGADRVFISHAHSDHVGLHREVILSKPTSKLTRARLEGDWQEHLLPFAQPTSFQGAGVPFQITLLPAGHILGSAMALIEAEGASLLYTGDFKLRPGLSAEKCEPCHADILIMETTYGRPEYRFPPTAEVLSGITRFCREALDNEETPVLLGYSLGKSQELLCGLAQAGLALTLHGTVHRLTRIYEQLGREFPPYQRFEGPAVRGTVFLCPPNVVNPTLLRKLGPARVAVLTGWAVDADCRFRYQAHAAFPLSDHADFPELVSFVQQVNPKQVYTLHGFAADFAQTLRDLGFQAQALSQDDQLSLPLPVLASRPKRLAPPLDPAPHAQQPAPDLPKSQHSHPVKPTTKLPPRTTGQSTTDRSNTDQSATGQPPPTTDTSKSLFHQFAETCSSIGSTAKKTEKTALVAAYLQSIEPEEVFWVSTWLTGHPFAPTDNKPLQLGWALIRDALCAVVEADQSEFGKFYLKHSDLGETAFEMLLKTAPGPSLPISAISALFQELYAARGPRAKLGPLARALRLCSALEGKYLVKILSGDLRIGLKEGLVEEAIGLAFGAPLDQVKNTNLLLGNIGETAVLAKRGQLTSASLVPFRPLKFMLASPEPTAADIWQRVLDWSKPGEELKATSLPLGPVTSPPTVWLEDKYDGVRCQVHKVGKRVSLYSRDLREITASFLEVADTIRAMPADFILDGELVAMRGDDVLPFAELQKRLGRREGDLFLGQQIPVQFVAFDLLWFNGRSYLDEPLQARRAQLEACSSGVLRLSQVTRVHSEGEIDAAFTQARARKNEGLMIKDPASAYLPGRRGLAWLKLKRALATLDCVVVGVEYGHGKRHAVLSDYTFAVRDDQTGELKTIGKAYSGLTDAEIARLTEHFLQKVTRRQGRYLEVEPDTVVEIAFDAVQPSDRHSSGLALRFPRIARLRPDKTPSQIDTIDTARKLVAPPKTPA